MQVQSSPSSLALAALASAGRSAPAGQDMPSAQAETGGAVSRTTRYDFSNMTPAQMRDAVNRMIRSGELSLDETGSLLSMMAPPSARLKAGGTPVPTAEAERIDNTPVDAFAQLHEGIAGARWRNDSAAEAALSRTIAALLRVQGTLSSVDILA
ncbi:putative protein OS=Afipia felis OX=1035 GN=NCTC12722_01926 PE=4 SV=1 [Afipia felis]